MIVCVKVGDKYDARYVNRLHTMVQRFTKTPHDFVCLTDDARDLTVENYPIETGLPGWWAKLILFKPHPVLPRNFVYLDLDTVIVDYIDFLFEYRGPFCALRDFWQAGVLNSSVMAFNQRFRYVWNSFDPMVMSYLAGDQDWITRCIRNGDVWQDVAPGRITSYKADNLIEGPKGAIVCFHGRPKPHDFSEGWVHEAWA